MRASTHSLPIAAAISDRYMPVYCLFSSLRRRRIKTPSGPAREQKFSHTVFWFMISSRSVARVLGSVRFSNSLLLADARGGKQAVKLVPPAVYGYMLACTSRPSERAASMRAMASSALYQFRRPPALRWKISTGTWPSRPMRIASSIASRNVSASERRCVM